MDTAKLKAYMLMKGDTQESLAQALGMSRPTLGAKLNEKNGAAFTLPEIKAIKIRYSLSESEVNDIFFADDVS